MIENVPAYAGFDIAELPLDTFELRWLPGLEIDGILVGLNWSGRKATGYDGEPAEVAASILSRRSRPL